VSSSPLSDELPADGDPDAYAEGWKALNKLLRQDYSWSGHERHAAFLNLADGTFADASRASGLDLADDGRALALVDWDHDGDEDLFLTQRSGPRVRLLENRVLSSPKTFAFRPEDERGNPLVGARVEVLGGGPALVRTLRAGEGYLAQSSAWLHFPSGGEVVVTWPFQEEPETFAGLESEGFFRLRRGSGEALRWRPPVIELAPTAPIQVEVEVGRPAGERIVLADPVPLPLLRVESSRAGEIELFGIQPGGASKGTGKPVVLHLFASWCAPCARELAELVQESDVLSASGIAFLALGIETDPEERAAARALMARLKWPFAWGFLQPESAEVLDGLAGLLLDSERRLPLPTSLLISAEGELRAIYFGPISADSVVRDLRLLRLDPADLLAAATPFQGRWHRPPSGKSGAFLEGRLRARGLEATAREYSRGSIQVVQSSPAAVLHGFARRAAAAGNVRQALGYLQEALTEDPYHFDSQFDLAVLLQAQGMLPEAVSAYGKALHIRPHHADTHFNLGLAYIALGDLDAARSKVRRLEEGNPELASLLEEEIGKKR
jgi:thiol-disulfide isomerase/thioredoxin